VVETAYWFFERFGEPKAVMQRGRQTLSGAGAGQAVVAIRAIGLNQSDYKYLLGTHFPPDAFPSCVAHEAVGEIVELGPDTDGLRRHANQPVKSAVCFDQLRRGVVRIKCTARTEAKERRPQILTASASHPSRVQ
jgi:NADPH:quinone reductase-like Zn-dependent oxidoreductase